VKHIKDLAGQTVIYGLSSIVSRFLNYLLTPLFTYLFTANQYGDITILYAYATFINIILTYGLETGFFYFSKKDYPQNAVFGTSLISIISTSLLFIGFSLLFIKQISQFAGYTSNIRYIFWFIVILSTDAITAIPFAKLRQQNKAFKFGFYKLLNVLLTIFVTILLLVIIPKFFLVDNKFLGFQYHLSVELVFIANVIGSVFTLCLFIPEFLKEKLTFSFTLWKEILKYSIPLMIGGLLGTIIENLDRVLLQIYLPTGSDIKGQIGIYGACVKVSVLMTLFTQMFRFAAEPYFFNKRKSENNPEILADVTKYFILFGFIIYLGIIAYLDIIQYFIGPEFRIGIKVVWVYMLGSLGLGIFFNLSFWYKLTDKTYYGILISGFGAFVAILLNILLIPYFGFYGSAWARTICYVVLILISYYLGQKIYPVNYAVKRLLIYLILTILFSYCCLEISFSNHILNIFKNTVLFLLLIAILEKYESIISIFIKRPIKS
jgi:O-antigen/teichoic acid export membrane protein